MPEHNDDVVQPKPGTGPTHAAPGQGRPRLVFVVDPETWDGTAPHEFDLLDPTTTIGASPDMDLQLAGLAPFHAEIRHDERDEYVLFVHGDAELSSELETPLEDAETAEPKGRILRTGARVQLGEWAMSYYREEYADHGRPFGGRQGGEGEAQLDQYGQPLKQSEG
jgi:hypothetical protein